RKLGDSSIYEKEKLTAIMVSPESTRAYVDRVFDHISKYYFKNSRKKVDSKDALLRFYDDVPKMFFPDTISNIERDRKWYWMIKNGMSLQEISNDEIDGNTEDSIRAAVKQYEIRLSMVI
ncbi:MAG: hypothetical protein AAB917_03200, partial [Patescibacteria group bacterium]